MKNVQQLQGNLKYSYKARTQHKTKNKKEEKHKEKIGQNSRAASLSKSLKSFQNDQTSK